MSKVQLSKVQMSTSLQFLSLSIVQSISILSDLSNYVHFAKLSSTDQYLDTLYYDAKMMFGCKVVERVLTNDFLFCTLHLLRAAEQ